MIEYTYNGFKLAYKIEQHKKDKNLFGSYGYIVNPEGVEEGQALAKFHTDDNTRNGVQTEIKKLMEDYIDFEVHQFKENAKENTKENTKENAKENVKENAGIIS